VKLVTVIGNRPQFIKAAAVSGPLRAEHEELLVHTGQHYDDELSTIFIEELGTPRPEVQLAISGGSNSEQTARMIAALAPLLAEQQPDAVLVYGDTNSTLAGALTAAQANIPVIFIEELGTPRPEVQLAISGGSNSEQTARMIAALAPLLAEQQPDAVLVYGDTNSTLAGALTAAQANMPVVHVEAGMRSFDRTMPEELNRILTDHCSELLLCPSQVAMANLQNEGLGTRALLVGDVMVDVAALMRPRAEANLAALEAAGVEAGGYLLATAHRAANVDDPARLALLTEPRGSRC